MREQVGVRPDGLGAAEHQEAVGLERVVEHASSAASAAPGRGRSARCGRRSGRAGRTGGSRVRSWRAKTHEVADGLVDPVVAVDAGEEPPQPLGRDVGGDVLGVEAGAGLLDGGLADVGGEDLDGRGARRRRRGTPAGRWRPSRPPRRSSSRAPRCGSGRRRGARPAAGHDARGKTTSRQRLERLGLAEEAGDVDQDVVVEAPAPPRAAAGGASRTGRRW